MVFIVESQSVLYVVTIFAKRLLLLKRGANTYPKVGALDIITAHRHRNLITRRAAFGLSALTGSLLSSSI
jgi:hypothetical protein